MIASKGQRGVQSLHYVNCILQLPFNWRLEVTMY